MQQASCVPVVVVCELPAVVAVREATTCCCCHCHVLAQEHINWHVGLCSCKLLIIRAPHD